MKKILVFIVAAVALFVSCKKDSFITSPDASLFITKDSIKFDTVFTQTGSVTQSFKIINENNQQLLLSKVKLMGGAVSAFKININGAAVPEMDNITIAANDSIYVFVSVTVDPTTADLPFVISDSILISYNSNDVFVQLEAYGQNAHFKQNETISVNTIWPNDLPYVILGGIGIAANATLTIEAGCKIYLHADAPFIVDGTLIIQGEKLNEVIFTGDRLDEGYRDLPASWPGIYFRENSKDNDLRFAIIKNANQAVVVSGPSVNTNPKLTLHQCIIDNAFDAGLLTFNSSVNADNTLISNCSNNISIQLGGDYTFTNCTVASFSTSFFIHRTPVLSATDFIFQGGTIVTAGLDALFQNCIFWGDYGTVDDEVVIQKEGSNPFNVSIENSIFKALNDPSNTTMTSVIRNQDPVFDSVDISNRYFDFRTSKDPFAPGIDQGVSTVFPKDLDDSPRTFGIFPDIGSYEKH